MEKWWKWWIGLRPWKIASLSGAWWNWVGFTLIELLVGISVITILFTISVAKYNEFNRRQILVQAAQELKSNLRLAQSKALAGEKPSGWCANPGQSLEGWRLSFDGSSAYSIKAVCTGDLEASFKTVTLPSSVTRLSGTSVLFKVLAQGVEAETSFTLSGYGESRKVTVTTTGEIKIE